MTTGSPSRPVRIAAAQYAPVIGDASANRAAAVRYARAAAERGADLVVLPELASSGYAFSSVDEAQSLSEEPAGGPLVAALTEVCREHGTHVVVGVAERARGRRHNSAAMVGPSGLLAVYRKIHLFNDEKSWFEPGENLPVVELPWGRVGMLVCFDIWFPEAARALALGGAEVIAVPTNWVSSFKRTVYDDRGYCQGDYVCMVRANENGCVVAAADRVGVERGLHFLGASIIVGADGWPVAGPASPDGEELLVADVDLAGVAAARRRTPRNDLLGDRRPQAYNAVPVTAPRGVGTGAGTRRGEP